VGTKGGRTYKKEFLPTCSNTGEEEGGRRLKICQTPNIKKKWGWTHYQNSSFEGEVKYFWLE
jgi:hypothetical protein